MTTVTVLVLSAKETRKDGSRMSPFPDEGVGLNRGFAVHSNLNGSAFDVCCRLHAFIDKRNGECSAVVGRIVGSSLIQDCLARDQ